MDQKEIVAEYKRQGLFDARRKQFFDTFVADETRQQQLKELIGELVKCKIEKEPELFSKNRGKVSALIQTELVKRHVEREKLSTSGGRADGEAGDGAGSGKDGRYSDTELLDRINDLLDSYVASVEGSEQVQGEIISQLTGREHIHGGT